MSLQDVEIRDQYVKEGWLRCQDLDDLRIYTYTNKTVFEKHWDNITIHSRGHIYNVKTGERVSCALPKFFNLNERPKEEPDLWLPCQVMEKIDGWFGSLYRWNNEYRIATRGSFESIGAEWSTKHLQENFDLTNLSEDVTLIFELIHPSLREESNLVVSYGGREDLVLLAAFNRHTGEELCWDDVVFLAGTYGFNLPKVYTDWNAFNAKTAAQNIGLNEEGYVLRFENNFRLKIKGDQYIKASQAIRLLTPMNLWKNMHNGKVYDAFLDIFPDDFKGKATNIACQLELEYAEIEEQAFHDIYMISSQGFENRRDFAEQAKKCKYTSAMFCLLDNEDKKFDNCIMQLLRERIKNATTKFV